MSEEQKRLHAIVHGIVQGVSFRYYTTKKARELGLTGWVQNLDDGSVETTAEGTRSQLETLEKWLYSGPPDAKVEAIYVDWEEATGEFSAFRTKYHYE